MSEDKDRAASPEVSEVSDSDSDIEFILEPQGTTSTPTAPAEQPETKSAEEATEDAIIKQSGDAAAGTAEEAAEEAKGTVATGSSTAPAGSAPKGTLDIDAIGEFEGVPIPAVVPGNLEEKPWRRPGTDLSDYFNYGFDEYTWMAYCNRQDKLRAHFTPQQVMSMGMPPMGGMPMGGMPTMPNMGMMPPFMMPPMMFPPQQNQ